MTSMASDPHLNTGVLALDAMPDDEATEAIAHTEDCESCAAELAGFLETAALLASVASEVPPAALRRAVLAAIAVTPQLPPVVGLHERHAPRAHVTPNPTTRRLCRHRRRHRLFLTHPRRAAPWCLCGDRGIGVRRRSSRPQWRRW